MRLAAKALAGALALHLLGCGGKTATPTGGADAAPEGDADAPATLSALPTPRYLLGAQPIDSLCATYVAVDGAGVVWVADRVCEGSEKLRRVGATTASELSALKARFDALTVGCARETLAPSTTAYFFEATPGSGGEPRFWWGCEEKDGGLASPFREIRDQMMALASR